VKRVGCVYRVGCAYVFVRKGSKYTTLEVDLDGCQQQDTIAREVARLVYDRVIARSEAWSRVLLDYPVEGRYIIGQLLEFIERGEVTLSDGRKARGVTLHFFKNPRVWVLAIPSHVAVVAEKHLVEGVVGEVARLLEHMPGSLGGGRSGGGPAPSQG
jgi:hypothetical protein